MSEKQKASKNRLKQAIAVATAIGAAGTFAALRGGSDKNPAEHQAIATTTTTLPEIPTTSTTLAATTTTTEKAPAKVEHKAIMTPEIQAELAKSAVQIMYRVKDSENDWIHLGGGNVVMSGGEKRVLSVGHAFAPDPNNPYPEGNGNPTKLKSNYEFSLQVDGKPIAAVNTVAISQQTGLDVALLSVDETPAYNNLEALHVTTEPSVGEPVAILTSPDSNGNKAMTAVGTYLGSTNIGQDQFRVGVVGIDKSGSGGDDDEVTFTIGGSGSGALSATNKFVGTLSFDLQGQFREQAADALNFNASNYSAVGGYSIVTPQNLAAFEAVFSNA